MVGPSRKREAPSPEAFFGFPLGAERRLPTSDQTVAYLREVDQASPRVALYTHKEPRLLLRGYEGQKIHRAERVECYAVSRELLDALAGHLDRRMSWTLSVTDGECYVDVGGSSYHGAFERFALPT